MNLSNALKKKEKLFKKNTIWCTLMTIVECDFLTQETRKLKDRLCCFSLSLSDQISTTILSMILSNFVYSYETYEKCLQYINYESVLKMLLKFKNYFFAKQIFSFRFVDVWNNAKPKCRPETLRSKFFKLKRNFKPILVWIMLKSKNRPHRRKESVISLHIWYRNCMNFVHLIRKSWK